MQQLEKTQVGGTTAAKEEMKVGEEREKKDQASVQTARVKIRSDRALRKSAI